MVIECVNPTALLVIQRIIRDQVVTVVEWILRNAGGSSTQLNEGFWRQSGPRV